MSVLSEAEIAQCYRVKAFLETRNYDLITEEDLHFLHEHWLLTWWLHQIKADAAGNLVSA